MTIAPQILLFKQKSLQGHWNFGSPATVSPRTLCGKRMKDRFFFFSFLADVCIKITFLENKVSFKIELKYFLMGVVIHTRSTRILECIRKKSRNCTATIDLGRVLWANNLARVPKEMLRRNYKWQKKSYSDPWLHVEEVASRKIFSPLPTDIGRELQGNTTQILEYYSSNIIFYNGRKCWKIVECQKPSETRRIFNVNRAFKRSMYLSQQKED